ncbi:MAG TPA: condensation domain-containing protein, partial [Polyangiaceae bacterium]
MTAPLGELECERGASFALTELQQTMLLNSMIAPRLGGYTLLLHLVVHEALNEERLERAWQQAVGQFPVLRTRFSLEGDLSTATQQVVPHASFTIEKHDLRSLNEADRAQRTKALWDRERRTPFDFAAGPPW